MENNLIETLEKLTLPTRGRMMTQEEIDRFDAAIEKLQQIVAPCRVYHGPGAPCQAPDTKLEE